MSESNLHLIETAFMDEIEKLKKWTNSIFEA
jgi:hypothetical protein